MFGKKIPNPEIERLDKKFKGRMISVIRSHSSTFIRLGTDEFEKIVDQNNSLVVFREDESRGSNVYPIMYFSIHQTGTMFLTEVDKQVKIK